MCTFYKAEMKTIDWLLLLQYDDLLSLTCLFNCEVVHRKGATLK